MDRRWRRLALAAVAVTSMLIGACGPAIDCDMLDADACREATAEVVAEAERHRPGVGITSVSIGADGTYTVIYGDGAGLGVTQ